MSLLDGRMDQFQKWDREWCLRLNRGMHVRWLRAGLRLASRLGDGVFWYGLMAALLAFHGMVVLGPVLHILLTGGVCTLIYKWLKLRTLRPRPYQVLQSIAVGAAPLDQFSFPSGHTLHAVAFSLMTVAYFPDLGWLVWPFTLAVALSRPVLGLHYPSDVLAGAVIGAAVALVSFSL